MTTFYPTEEEFALGPLKYVEKITAQASATGIARIVPPASWDPPPLALAGSWAVARPTRVAPVAVPAHLFGLIAFASCG